MSATRIPKVKIAVFDIPMMLSIALLTLIGLVAMASASMELASTRFDDSFYHLNRQLSFVFLGLITGAIFYRIPLSVWEQYGWVALLLSLGLLVLVLIPGVGKEVKGSQRWIPLGPVNFQVSEIAKLFVVVYIAGYLVRRSDEVQAQWSGFMKPLAVTGLLTVLLLAEPDFGASVVMMSAVLGMIFLGGVRVAQFAALVVVCISAAAAMVYSSEYRMRRLTAFVDPWAEQFEGGYQLVQSLIAFGRGEVFGLGLGNSLQKLYYLPEAHTDFVFAIWAEETGAIGALLVLAIFVVLIARILWLAKSAVSRESYFGAHLCHGIAILIAAQVFINIGVNVGLLPTKGLTLPFFSYGGSSIITMFLAMALVCRVHTEVYATEETANG